MDTDRIKELREELGIGVLEARNILEREELLKKVEECDVSGLRVIIRRLIKKVY